VTREGNETGKHVGLFDPVVMPGFLEESEN
jgi:hypothetical protein